MLPFLRRKHKALVVGPGGLGDQIWMSGAVRYIAQQYDETHLVCTYPTLATLQTLYKDIPSVKLFVITQGSNTLWEWMRSRYPYIYACAFTKGLYRRHVNMDDLPGVFYDQMEIPRSVRHSHFVLPVVPESMRMYELVESRPYIFVHTVSSSSITPIISWDINTIFTIDPNVSHYPLDHPWRELSEKFVDKPFFHYCDLLKHAEQLHLTNSSFYTLASHISPLDANVKLCYEREHGTIIQRYDFS
jgi:hypothetical protein